MRIRTIKPEFWRSEDVAALSLEARLVFIGLWSYVDDSGVGLDRVEVIAAELFAGDLAQGLQEVYGRVHGALTECSSRGLITRYTVAGKRYLAVVNFLKHQRINRPSPSRYPPPTCEDAVFSEDSVSTHVSLNLWNRGTGEQGNRGTGEAKTRRSATPRGRSAPLADTAEFVAFWAAYPRKVGKEEARKKFKIALAAGIDPERIIAGARRYRDDPNREERFTAHPATWLNQGRYDDETPEPSRREKSRSEQRWEANLGLVAKFEAEEAAAAAIESIPHQQEIIIEGEIIE